MKLIKNKQKLSKNSHAFAINILRRVLYYIMDFWNLKSPRKFQMLKNLYCIHIRSAKGASFSNSLRDDSENVRIEIPIFTSVEERANFCSRYRFYFKQIDRGLVHWSVKFNTAGSTFAKKRENSIRFGVTFSLFDSAI